MSWATVRKGTVGVLSSGALIAALTAATWAGRALETVDTLKVERPRVVERLRRLEREVSALVATSKSREDRTQDVLDRLKAIERHLMEGRG